MTAVNAYIVDAVRSPIGRRNGTLAAMRGDDLAAQVLNALVARSDLDPAAIEDVQMGCVTQIGEQGWNVGRMAVLAAGWPVSVAATTVDRQCGSSMQTNFNAAAAVASGQLDLVVSAGVEMMSRVPMGSNGGSISDEVTSRHEIVMQGTSAELLAQRVGDLARGAGRVLVRVAPAGGRRNRRGAVRERDRADRASGRAFDRRRRDPHPLRGRRGRRGGTPRWRSSRRSRLRSRRTAS